MSLKVWLPLDGDLHNQGISNVTITAPSGVTVDNTGKIGKCYTSAGTVNGSVNACELNMSQFSIAAWVRINTRTNSWNCSFKLVDNSDANSYQYCGFCCEHSSDTTKLGFHFYSVIDGTNTGIFDAYPAIISDNNWHHFAFAYDGVHVTYYQDGVVLSTATIASARQNTSAHFKQLIMFGANGSRAASTIKTSLNDVRIYDYCLSAAEVREIAQGLILHYKLDDAIGFTDLIARNVNVNAYNNHGNTNNPTTVTYLSQQYNGDRIIQYSATPNSSVISSIQTSLHSHGIYNWNRTFKANTKYVFWIYYKPITHLDTIVGGTASNIGGWTEIPPVAVGNGWYRVGQYRNGTVTTDKTDNIFVSYKTPSAIAGDNIIIYFASPHLLEGTTEIPPYDYPSTIIQDSSGYNHNGIITGTLTINSNTSRYSSSIYISNGVSNYITTPVLQLPGNAITMNFWFKSSNKSPVGSYHMPLESNSAGYYEISISSGGTIRGGLYVNGTRYVDNGTTAKMTDDNWHMGTMTFDGSTIKRYVDGEMEKSTSASGTLNTQQSFIIGHYGTSTSYAISEGYISDVRIYCTSLLDTDIKQLYNVGMKIDKLGNMHPFELEENIGMVPNVKFVNNSANSITYDATTDTYTIVSKADTSSWGYGVRLADDPPLWVPYGATYRWTAEVWTPIALSVNTDYNNTTGSTDTNWAGNDNDATGTRLAAGASIPANTWTRIYRGASNTNTGNTNHLPIRDYSSLGLVTNGQSNPVTWKIRHLQWYLIDNTFKPQLKRTGVFKSSHFTEIEEDLNKPAQLNKKMFSTNATQFIER